MATTTERHIIEVGISGSDSAASELAALSAAARRAMKGISDALESLSAFKTIKIRVDTGDATRSVNRLRDQLQSTFRPLLGYTSESARNRSREAQFGWRRRRHNALAYSRGQAEYLGALFGANFAGPGVPLLGMSDTENFTNSDLDKLYRLKEMREKLRRQRERQASMLTSYVPTTPSSRDIVDAEYTMIQPSGGGSGGSGEGIFSALSAANNRLGTFISSVTGAIRPFRMLIRTVTALVALLKYMNNFRIYKESNVAGLLSSGDATYLNKQRRANVLLGGDAASISAMHRRTAMERAMLAYGGNGGSFMEAARLFGVNIFGSGRYGFATNKEYLGNIAERMSTLDESGKIALAGIANITPEQFFAMRKGRKGWEEHLRRSTTFLERVAGLEKGTDGENYALTTSGGAWHGEVMQESTESFAMLWESIKELILVLSDALLPFINTIADILSKIIQVLSLILSPLAKLVSYVGRFLNALVNWSIFKKLGLSSEAAQESVNNTPSASQQWQKDDRKKLASEERKSISINNVTINAKTPDEAREFMQAAVDGAASAAFMNMEDNGMNAVA